MQFLGEESRSWISGDCVKRWKEREAKGSEGEKDEAWIKGVEEADMEITERIWMIITIGQGSIQRVSKSAAPGGTDPC